MAAWQACLVRSRPQDARAPPVVARWRGCAVADGLDGALAAVGTPPGAWPSGVIATNEQAIACVLAAAESKRRVDAVRSTLAWCPT